MSEKKTVWQKIGLFFFSNKKLTSLLFVILTIFGLLSYTRLMQREGFPNIETPIGIIQVVSFDGGAEQNDITYSKPISEVLLNDDSVKSVSTNASAQGVTANIVFKEGTDVQEQLDRIKSQLTSKIPNDSRISYLKLNAGKLDVEGDDLLISVHSDGLSLEQLDEQVKELSSKLQGSSSLIDSVHPFYSFEQDIDQTTGQQSKIQVRFDRYYDGESKEILPSTVIGVAAKSGSDQLKLYDDVNSFLNSSTVKDLGIEAKISTNFADGIREQISGLQRNLLEGLAVVLLVSFILISLRSSIVTALSMTATILITVGVLYLIGYSLNTITLFSLILCLALIVDDTTIMVEAIDAGLRKGGQFRTVVSEAMRKVTRASATGTLVTMLAFAPMLFINGILGQFIKAIPVTIIISLAVSLVVSFVFIPLLVRVSYGKSGKHSSRKVDIAEKIENGIGDRLARTLIWSDKNKKRRWAMRILAIVISLTFLISGGNIFKHVGFNIFPSPKDGQEIYINGQVVDRDGATIENTEMFTDKVLEITKDQLGENLEHLTLAGYSGSATKDGFSAVVRITPIGTRDKTAVELAEELQSSINSKQTDVRVTAESAGVGPPSGSFSAQIASDNTESSYRLANDLKQFLTTTVLKRADNSTANLKDITITPKIIINREDGNRLISVNAGFDAKDTSLLVALAQDAVNKEFTTDKIKSYGLNGDELKFSFGQEDENQESFNSMGKSILPLFLAMFLVMAILFRSILQPFLILMALPFAIFGVASGLYLTNNEISFFSMLGVFALIGISLNNTILLTDYANQANKSSKKASEAMAAAIRERLRPLLTTSVTSVLAMLPLALNDPFWEGLAFALIFGLISSTILVIIVFPYFYLINDSISTLFKKLFNKLKSLIKKK